MSLRVDDLFGNKSGKRTFNEDKLDFIIAHMQQHQNNIFLLKSEEEINIIVI